MRPAKLTRRQLLRGAGRLAVAAAASSLMPPNVRRMLAQQSPTTSSLRDVKHLVMLMQENRSFDHYFGTLSGVRGFDDPEALRLPSGRSVFYQPDDKNPNGYLLPFHLDTNATSAQKIPSTSHAWAVQHEAWNGGRMDRWLPAHRTADGANGPYCMGYHTRGDIPFQFALAEAFTLCDAYHCSVLGPTWPNRMYWMTGTIDAEGGNGGPIINNTAPDRGYGWTTYAERLEKSGIGWKVYQQEDNYGCNLLETFRVFREAAKGSALYDKGMLGSAQQSVRVRILRGFLKSHEFGLCGGQALRLQQQVVHVSITKAATEQSFDVAVDGFYHTHRYLRPAIVQDALEMTQQHAG